MPIISNTARLQHAPAPKEVLVEASKGQQKTNAISKLKAKYKKNIFLKFIHPSVLKSLEIKCELL